MTEALLSQVIGVLLFVTVVVIVIIVVAEFSIKAGAKRKRESAEHLNKTFPRVILSMSGVRKEDSVSWGISL